MRLRVHIMVGAVFVIIIAGLILTFKNVRSGELFDKRGWSVLQGMNDPPSDQSPAVLRKVEEFDVLGFRGVGEPRSSSVSGPKPRWSWVLLNEHHGSAEIKQMPQFGSYELPCSELAKVKRAARDVDGYVLNYLRSVCR